MCLSALRVITTLYGLPVELAEYLGVYLLGKGQLLRECKNDRELTKLLTTCLVCPTDGLTPDEARGFRFDRSYSSQYDVVSDAIKVIDLQPASDYTRTLFSPDVDILEERRDSVTKEPQKCANLYARKHKHAHVHTYTYARKSTICTSADGISHLDH